MKTKDRILLKSLALFNQDGERSITTNHIASALNMSPGNLYYHFRSKEEIIYEIFLMYERSMLNALTVPSDRVITYTDKMGYFEAIFNQLWEYRFLHRDLGHLLEESPRLRASYRQFAGKVMAQAYLVYNALRKAEFIKASEQDVQAMIVNIWIITTSWASFVVSSGFFGEEVVLSQRLLRRGIYQIICLEAPYLQGEALEKLPDLLKQYGDDSAKTV
ncbi:TetR/AcrR family transcriptional regulator [Agitococcus lubricus]|uniref:TetR family transcriptional regulator n=1 Tax=Agitococcus lubricus TaxID=1077255 RepID=A0A2T5IZX8_9GAMM|nr:TetR/AcrR family transcriptional regulator [Agitococcus lubricus]PTQ89621.1 TetR family transcriptional regulator [Agitococcus lubricus]